MKNTICCLLLTLIFPLVSAAQVSGCTDPMSANYNPLAETNDGSCVYAPQAIAPLSSFALSDTLRETSGLIFWNGQIWTHNDNTDTNLYAISPANGQIQQIKGIANVENADWEEVSQDENYIYIGDFGNNSTGNRTDLRILRISKSILPSPGVDTISFSYSNQMNFAPSSGNNTNFDCEAFIVSSDSIFLFTKRWVDKKTFLYGFPKLPGNYTAVLKDSMDIQGLVTGATYVADKRIIVLSAYTSTLQPFLLALYDFNGTNFFAANKRRFTISMPYTQAEGICTNDGLTYYVSNERLVSGPINSPQRLHQFNLADFLQSYYTASMNSIEKQDHPVIFPNPSKQGVNIRVSAGSAGNPYTITDASGKVTDSGIIENETIQLKVSESGIYFFQAKTQPPVKFVIE